jgi:hypothetical protein
MPHMRVCNTTSPSRFLEDSQRVLWQTAEDNQLVVKTYGYFILNADVKGL